MNNKIRIITIVLFAVFLFISCGHRSKLCPVLINDQDFSIPDFFIDLQLLFADSQHLQTYYFQTKIKCVLFKKVRIIRPRFHQFPHRFSQTGTKQGILTVSTTAKR